MEREQVARLRVLYPSTTDDEVLQLWRDAGDSVPERDAMIDYLYNERGVMDSALGQWLEDVPIGPARNARALAVARIQRCWAKEGFTPGVAEELNLDDLDLSSLPTLRAHFGHVTLLSLKNNRLGVLPERFVRCFPRVRIIYINGNQLTRFPYLEGLADLEVLNLANNQLSFNLQDEYRLAALTSLSHLDLSMNPLGLGRQLSFYGLPNLRELRLRGAGLSRLPRGAVSLEQLRSFDVRDNQIHELSETEMFIYPSVHRGMNLRGNPLSGEARQMLRRLGERQGRPDVDFGLWEPAASLDRGADRWLALLPPGEVQERQRHWALLQEQPMADYFFELLGSIANDQRFIDPQFRPQRETVARRIWTLLDEALSQEGVEQIALSPAYRYMSGGLDGWLLCLHELELRMLPRRMLAGEIQNAGAQFVHYYRALRRLDSLDQHLARYFPSQSVSHACTRILSYRIALANILNLPEVLSERFDAPTEVPDTRSVNILSQAIVGEELQMPWPSFLEKQHYWVTFLERKYAGRFATALKGYVRPLEIAADKVADAKMNEGEYLNYIGTLQAARQKTRNELIRQLTLEEWNDFVIG